MMTGTGYARSRRDEEKETREEEPTKKREEEAKKAKTRVELVSPPKGTPPIAMVSARHARGMIERAARGFSLGELSASALSFQRAKKWRVPLDLRRKTALDDNVTRLTSWLHVAKPKPEKPKLEAALKAEVLESEKPKEEEKPLEVAKPKAQRGLRREEPKKKKPVKEPKKAKPVKEPRKEKPAKEEKKEKPVKEPKKVARSKPAKKTKTKAKKE